uniref:methyltransferase family protein n=1 Tax=Actinotalea sp. C106 TaxID=2908644 RepID=UPI00253FF167
GELHERGVYAVSRHPIYTGLLVATAGWAVLRRRPEPVVAWLALLAVLDAKTRREEQRLVARFGDRYVAYRARTPRLLALPGRTAARRP